MDRESPCRCLDVVEKYAPFISIELVAFNDSGFLLETLPLAVERRRCQTPLRSRFAQVDILPDQGRDSVRDKIMRCLQGWGGKCWTSCPAWGSNVLTFRQLKALHDRALWQTVFWMGLADPIHRACNGFVVAVVVLLLSCCCCRCCRCNLPLSLSMLLPQAHAVSS